MAKRYQKDIKVVLPKSNPFRDIAVYGAGEEIIKALGGQLADKGKQPDIVSTSNSPYFKKRIKKFGEGGKKDLNTNPNFITSPSGKTPIQPLNVPGRYSEDQNNINIQKRKEKFANQPLHPLAQGALDIAGLAYYPAAVLGSGIDAYKGNYGGAAAGLVPFSKSFKNIKSLMGIANQVGAKAGKISKATKEINTGIVGANAYDIYDDFIKDNINQKAYGGPINNTDNMKKSNKKGQSPRSILSPEQRMAMQFGWGGALGTVLGTGAALGLTAMTGGLTAPLIPAIAGAGASIGGSLGSNIEQGIDKNKQARQPQFQQPQYQQALPQQMQFAKGGMLNKRGIPHRGSSEQMPYQTQMQSYPNLEFGNGEQMLANGGQLDDTEMFAGGGIHIKPSKRGTFTAAATKHGKSVQGFASQVLANKGNYSPAMVKKANFARNAAKWKHADGGMLNPPLSKQELKWLATGLRGSESADYLSGTYVDNTIRGGDTARIKRLNDLQKNQLQKYMQNTGLIEDIIEGITPNTEYFNPKPSKSKLANGGFLNEPTEGVIERRNKNRSREPQEYATFEENFKHMYAQGGRMGAMGPMDMSKIYYADGGMLNHYTGERHENGGIPMGPNAEVEGGETSMKMGMGGEQDSTYIFSDRLQVPGKKHTFAEASKKIDNKYGRRTNDKLSDESKRLELNKLMESQEQERAGLVNSAYETIAAYGGPIRKYAVGGGTDPIAKTSSYYDFNSSPLINELNEGTLSVGGKPYNPEIVYRRQDALGLPYNQFEENRNARINSDLNPEVEPKKPNFIQRAQQNRLDNKMKFNPNAYLDNQGNKADLTAEEMRRDAANIGAVPSRGVSNIATPQRSAFSPQQEADMLKRDMENTKRMGMSPMTPRNIQNIPSGNTAPDTLQNIAAPDFNEQAADTSGRFGTGEQWAKGIGYGLQGAGLLARQLQLSSKKNKLRPNKAFTMERQLLNADPQLREADISAAIANRNIRDLGASTSSGGAMAGYLAAQAGRTRSKADIMSDLQNRQLASDMTTGQYNAMAGERAYDKDAADRAAQQTAQAQWFTDASKLGSGITRDYLLGQTQEGLLGNMRTPDYGYRKVKGRNRADRYYTNENIG